MQYVDAYSQLEEPLDGDEKPWCDMVFDLIDHRVEGKKRLFGKDDRRVAGKALASTPRGVIGFEFETAPVLDWDVRNSRDVPLAFGKVTLRSLGAETDRLVREYAEWWGIPANGLQALPAATYPAVLLNGAPRDLIEGGARTKLFFELGEPPEDEEAPDPNYGELFLAFNVTECRVWLSEKDPDYRSGVVNALTRGRLESVQ